MDGLHDLFLLAERQHGLFSDDDRRRLGVPRAVVVRRVRQGSVERLTRRVLRLVGSPRTPEQRVLAGVLDAGPFAVASHGAAAWLWGLPGFEHPQVEVSQLRVANRRPSTLAVVHRPVLLLPHHVTQVRSITTMSLVHTIFQLAGILHRGRTARIVDTVVGRHPHVLPALHAALDELAVRGKPGIAPMREILGERPIGVRRPESGLERQVNRILVRAGERPLTPQVDVGGSEWLGRADFVDLDLGVILEVLSATYHSSHADRLADEARLASFLAAGFNEAICVWEDQVWQRPWEVVEAVRAARARARRRSREGFAPEAARNHPENGRVA